MLINQIHFQSKIISPLNLIMFLLLWFVFILFNSLSLLFDCFPCVQLNSEFPLQVTKGYNDMTMLQSSQYFFSYFFLILFENLFWSWRGRLRREESVTGRRRGRATETQTASGRTSQQGQACIKAYTLLVSFFLSKQPFKCIYVPNWAAMQLFTHPFCIVLLPKSLK